MVSVRPKEIKTQNTFRVKYDPRVNISYGWNKVILKKQTSVGI